MNKKEEKVFRLKSPEPINDGGRKYNKMYFVLGGIGAVVGLFSGGISGLLFFALIMLVLALGIKYYIVDFKLKWSRNYKFALDKKVPGNVLIEKLIPILLPLNMTIEKDTNGLPIITYKNIIFDIIYNDDDTFTIWWRRSIMRSFFSLRGSISLYRDVVVVMGIVGYNIQKICSDYNIDETDKTDDLTTENQDVNEFVFCTQCGTKNKLNSSFCINCGYSMK